MASAQGGVKVNVYSEETGDTVTKIEAGSWSVENEEDGLGGIVVAFDLFGDLSAEVRLTQRQLADMGYE